MKFLKIAILVLLILKVHLGFSQNSSCSNAAPFCTGQTMSYPAGVNSGPAQSGPDYGCLGSEPNPAWFFMQMANSGSMSIVMSAANDIDFICWGPFSSLSGACGSLTSGNIQSCSYSGSSTETCTIANAVAGQFYIMLITNYSNQSQTITFDQNNIGSPGAASTNCGFVCIVTATTTPPICSGQSATIGLGPGTSTAVVSYTWSGPNFNSTIGTNVISNLQASSMYTVTATSGAIINNVPYSQTCQAVVNVSVVPYPSFSITPASTTICQGGSFFAGVTFTPAANPSGYSYLWSPNFAAGGVWNITQSVTMIAPLLAPPSVTLSTLIYSVMVTPSSTLAYCPVTKTMTVTLNNPATPTISPPNPVCNTSSAVQLSATPGGGTWTANSASVISLSGLFTPSLATIPYDTVKYKISIGNCIVSNTAAVPVSRYYSPALTSTISTVCVQDPAFNLMNIVQNTLTGSWSGPQVTGNFFNPTTLGTGVYNFTYNTTSFPNPAVCPDYTVLSISVFKPPVPIITAIQPICTNAGTVSLTANPSGGVWSGATGVSPLGIQTPSLNIPGTSTVTYVAGLGTCVASSSKIFHVSQFNSAALTGSIPPLCHTGNPVNLLGIVQSTAGTWTGPGMISNSVFSPANLPTNIYNVVYSVNSSPNQTLCPDSRTLAISVLNPPIPTIQKAGPFCTADSPLQLTVTPATGYWVSSSYLSSAGVFSPGISPIGLNGVQYVIGTNTCYAQQTLLLITEAFISSGIKGGIPDLCTTSPQMNLLPITLSNLGYWTGTGIIGANFDPSLSGAGNFTLTYNTASIPSGLCPDHSLVSVNVFSLALPSITQAGPFCNKALAVQLQVSPVGGLFAGSVWGAVSVSGEFNPALARIGDNIISYSISSGPCIADVQTHISVEEFVSADFSNVAKTTYCSNDFSFNLNGLVQHPGGIWNSSPAIKGYMFDPSKAPLGINTVTYQTHSTPNTLLCPDTKTLNIIVKNSPQAKASSNSYKGCAPFEVVLSSDAQEAGGVYSWNLGDGTDIKQSLNSSYIFRSPGSYTVVFNYADNEAFGCSTQVILNPIQVFETPKTDFLISPEEITIANPEVSFTNLSTDIRNNRYVWNIQGLNELYDINPTVYFPQIGNYKVTLSATTINNCKSVITKIIEVKNDFDVYIPNSFTPNYDGLNDTFKPVFSLYGLDTQSYLLEIFDRWGHELFSTKDHTIGWDGTIQNKGEEPLKTDTYVFKLKYKDLNGQVYNKIGDVTLLK